MKKLKTLWWFLKHPHYLPQVGQILKRKKFSQQENTYQKAIEWCKKNTVLETDVLKELGIGQFFFLEKEYPEIYKKSKMKEKQCPFHMGGEGAINFLYTVTKILQPKKIVETGVAYGWSTLSILLGIKNIPDSKLISNDMPYIKMGNEQYIGCVVPEYLSSKWELQLMPDIKGIPLALNKLNHSIDMAHYDSDKSYTGRMFAYSLLWEALKKGGIFISDDIQDNIAFLEFSKKVEKKPLVFSYQGKYVGVLIK